MNIEPKVVVENQEHALSKKLVEKFEAIGPGELYPAANQSMGDNIMLKVRSRVDGVKYGEIIMVDKDDADLGGIKFIEALVNDWAKHLERKIGKKSQIEYMRSDRDGWFQL